MTESYTPSQADMEAYSNLGKVLDGFRRTSDGRTNRNWSEYRQDSINKYGEDAIASLIPDQINFLSGFIVRTFDNFAKNDVTTIQQLVDLDLNNYERRTSGFGLQSLKFSKILKEVARVELKRKSG